MQKLKVDGKAVKVVYEETYKDTRLRKDALPTLNHLLPGHAVVATEVLSAGRLEDGREFQTIRVVIAEVGAAAATAAAGSAR